MDQVDARDVYRSLIYSIQLCNAQTYRVVSVRRPCRKHSLLLTFKLWRRNFCLPVVVLIKANVKDEDNPDIAKVFETF